MDFGSALNAVKTGSRIAREGWNGKGMWVTLMPGYPDGVPANLVTARAHGIEVGAKVVVRPYLVMRAVDGTLVNWTISQTDALAEDWTVVSPGGVRDTF
jgi:hypothetical protein